MAYLCFGGIAETRHQRRLRHQYGGGGVAPGGGAVREMWLSGYLRSRRYLR